MSSALGSPRITLQSDLNLALQARLLARPKFESLLGLNHSKDFWNRPILLNFCHALNNGASILHLESQRMIVSLFPFLWVHPKSLQSPERGRSCISSKPYPTKIALNFLLQLQCAFIRAQRFHFSGFRIKSTDSEEENQRRPSSTPLFLLQRSQFCSKISNFRPQWLPTFFRLAEQPSWTR